MVSASISPNTEQNLAEGCERRSVGLGLMPDRQPLPPRVVIVMSDQWRRALLRAALRDAGYDAIGTRGVAEASVIRLAAPDRGSVRLMILDHDTLGKSTVQDFLAQRERLGTPEVVLLARATVAPPEGPWREVLRRPFTIDDVVHAVQHVLPLPTNLKHAIDDAGDE